MRILVSGADGPLGALLVERLMGQDEVVALVPTHARATALPPQVSAVSASPERFEEWAELLTGVQALVHLTDPTPAPGPAADPGRQLASVEAMLEAAEWRRVRRVIHVGRSALGCASAEPWTARSGEHPESSLFTSYPSAATALAAEELARPHAVLLSPARALAPGDPTGEAAALLRWSHAATPTPPGGLALVDLRDLPGAVESALQKGQVGRRYPLASRNITWRRLRGRLLRSGAKPSGTEPAPGWPPLGRYDEAVDDRRSRTELGWWHRSLERTLAQVFGSGAAELSQRA